MIHKVSKSKVAVASGAILGSLVFGGLTTLNNKDNVLNVTEKVIEPQVKNIAVAKAHEQGNILPEMQTSEPEIASFLPTPTEESIVIDDPDYILPEAIDAYLSDYNVSKEEARYRLQRQGPLSDTLQEIIAIEGDDKVAAWSLDHGENFKGWVQLVGNPVLQFESQNILAANPDIEIRYDAIHTNAELESAHSTLHTALGNSILEAQVPAELKEAIAYTDLNPEENGLTVALNKDWQTKSWSSQEEMQDFAQAYFDDQLDVPVEVILDSAFADTASVFGGKTLDGCTAGFPVVETRQLTKNVTGTFKGVLTAGHCGNNQGSLVGSAIREINGGDRDVQFHRIKSGHSVSKYTVVSRSPTRFKIMTGVKKRTAVRGAMVCKTGFRSGTSCGTVWSINAYRSIPSATFRGRGNLLIRGQSLRNCPGDSGGPVFINNLAVGLLSAQNDTRANDCSYNKRVVYVVPIQRQLDHTGTKLYK